MYWFFPVHINYHILFPWHLFKPLRSQQCQKIQVEVAFSWFILILLGSKHQCSFVTCMHCWTLAKILYGIFSDQTLLLQEHPNCALILSDSLLIELYRLMPVWWEISRSLWHQKGQTVSSLWGPIQLTSNFVWTIIVTCLHVCTVSSTQ